MPPADPESATRTRKKAKKAQRAAPGSRKVTNLQTYIHKIHKRLHAQNLGIADGAMRGTNALLVHFLNGLCAQALKTASFHKKSTLRAKHVKAALLVLTPPEFSTSAVAYADAIVAGQPVPLVA